MDPGYQIDIQTETTIAFDHENHKWSPAYLLLSGPELIDAGLGKLVVTGSATTATLCSPDLAQITRVAERYRELTGQDPIVMSDKYQQITPDLSLYEQKLWVRDRGESADKSSALSQAIHERWEPKQ